MVNPQHSTAALNQAPDPTLDLAGECEQLGAVEPAVERRDDPEDLDGYKDHDGCPEPGPEAAEARVTDQGIDISHKIFFEFDSAKLLPEAETLLGRVGAALMSDDLADFRFAVEGHTDSVGSADYNARLSENRSQAVKAFLIARGVPERHLAARGHGEEQPAASNESDEGRQRNRRV